MNKCEASAMNAVIFDGKNILEIFWKEFLNWHSQMYAFIA